MDADGHLLIYKIWLIAPHAQLRRSDQPGTDKQIAISARHVV